MSGELFDRHKALLELAVAAVASRGGFSAYPDDVANVNEVVAAEGTDAFNNYCGSYFYLDQPGSGERVGGEISAYGRLLDVQYRRRLFLVQHRQNRSERILRPSPQKNGNDEPHPSGVKSFVQTSSVSETRHAPSGYLPVNEAHPNFAYASGSDAAAFSLIKI